MRAAWKDRGLTVLAIAAVLGFYTWTAESSGVLATPRGQFNDYYSLLVHGFQHGHLSLDAPVDPAMLAAPDPYAYAVWRNHGWMVDASYFQGKYYLYFGAVPAVLVLLPYRLATGFDLSPAFATYLMASLAFLVLTGLIVRWRRAYFPQSGAAALFGAILLIGFNPGVLAAIRRPWIYELPIVSGLVFLGLMLHCLSSAIARPSARRWMVGAGLCLGLAVGSRPPLLFAGLAPAGLVGLWFLADRRAGSEERSPSWRRAAVGFGAAFGAVFAILLLYNFARFGHPFEFGFRYQLTDPPASQRHFLDLRYLPFNARAYYGNALAWSRHFPFFQIDDAGNRPAHYFLSEWVYGCLKWAPAVWFALAAPLALWRREAGSGTIAAVVSVVALAYAGPGLFDLLIESSAIRYTVDFLPCLALTAALGVFALERALPRRLARTGIQTVWIGSVLVSVGVAAIVSVSAYGQIMLHRGRAYYESLARTANVPAFWYERLRDWRYGPITLDLVLPNQPGSAEILARTPRAAWMIDYPTADAVRFGLRFLPDGNTLWGDPMPAAAGSRHVVSASFGSLYPAEEHPYYFKHAFSPMLRLAIAVDLDGRTALSGFRPLDPVDCRDIQIAADPAEAGWFSGRIEAVSRNRFRVPLGIDGSDNPVLPGSVDARLRLRLVFPPSPAWGLREPILVTGVAGACDVITIIHYGGGQMRFCLDHWGRGPDQEGPLLMGVDYAAVHDVEIATDAFALYHGDRRPTRAGIRIRMDGRDALDLHTLLFPAALTEAVVGENQVGATGEQRFDGVMLQRTWRSLK